MRLLERLLAIGDGRPPSRLSTAAISASVSASPPVTSSVSPSCAVAGEDDRAHHVGDVGARDDARAPPAARSGDRAVGQDHAGHEVEVEAHAEEGPAQVRGADPLLRRPVVAGELERGVGRGAEEGEVDEPLHARGLGRLDDGDVLGDPVGVLLGGDEEQGVDARERRAHRLARVVAGHLAHLGAVEARRPRRLADDEALGGAGRGQARGHAPTDEPRGARHGDQRLGHPAALYDRASRPR